MSVRETIRIGYPVLRETAASVANFKDISVTEIITDLIDTMRAEDLVGIAAPQIGESVSICISEIRETEIRKGQTDELCVYINPVITDFSAETERGWEGCGSIPGILGQVERSLAITVAYCDVDGKKQEKTCSGLLARILQHEVDHLHGILFTDLCDPRSLVSRDYYLKHIVGVGQ